MPKDKDEWIYRLRDWAYEKDIYSFYTVYDRFAYKNKYRKNTKRTNGYRKKIPPYTKLNDLAYKAFILKLDIVFIILKDIEELPDEFYNLPNLEQLNIMGCDNFKLISKKIANFKKLKSLYIFQCSITSLPEEICEMKNIEQIVLSQNHLSSLPACVFTLPKLESLHLEDNNLKELSIKAGDLQSLKTICLQKNDIDELPKEIGKISNLKSLGICDNNITSLPTEIKNLVKLEEICIDEHLINLLPKKLKESAKVYFL